jgi:hypothetical protein
MLELFRNLNIVSLLVALFMLCFFGTNKASKISLAILWTVQIIVEILGKYFFDSGKDFQIRITYDTATLLYSLITGIFYTSIFHTKKSKVSAVIITVTILLLNVYLITSQGLSSTQTNAIVVLAIATLILSIIYLIDNSVTNSSQNLFLRPSFWINMSMAVSSVMLIIRFGIAYYLFEKDLAFLSTLISAHLYLLVFCNLLLIFAVVYPAYKYRNTTPFTIEL